jgi:hypothetical protein
VKFDPISELPIAVKSQSGTVRHPRISMPAGHVCRTWYERCSVNPKTAIVLRILLSFMASIRPARTLPLDSVKQTLVRRAVGRRVWVGFCRSGGLAAAYDDAAVHEAGNGHDRLYTDDTHGSDPSDIAVIRATRLSGQWCPQLPVNRVLHGSYSTANDGY